LGGREKGEERKGAKKGETIIEMLGMLGERSEERSGEMSGERSEMRGWEITVEVLGM